MAGKHRDEANFAERMMKQVLKALIMMLLFVVVLALIILPLLKDKLGEFGLLNTGEEASQLAIEDVSLNHVFAEGVGYQTTVKGVLKNSLNKDVSDVAIEILVYNEMGEELGSAYAIVEHVKQGDSIAFEAGSIEPFEDEPVSYKIKRVIHK